LQKKKPALKVPENIDKDGKMLAYLDDQVINYTCRLYEKRRSGSRLTQYARSSPKVMRFTGEPNSKRKPIPKFV